MEQAKKFDSRPGSGKLWKHKLTVPREFSLSKNKSSSRFNPVHKQNRSMELSRNKSFSIYHIHKNVEKPGIMKLLDEREKNGIRINEPMDFNNAIAFLHNTLHNLNLEY